MQPYLFIPEDRSFFRDARPMSSETGSGGHGARWPDPSQIFTAVHGALHLAFPRPQAWEHNHPTGRNGDYPDRGNRPQRFGSLTTVGPFPCQWDSEAKQWRWLFPRPADVVLTDGLKRLHPIQESGGGCDLAAPLRYSLGNPCPPTKVEPASWWTREAWQAYLGESTAQVDRTSFRQTEELYGAEWTPGIGMDPGTQAQDGERIYSAQYLRLREDVAFGFAAAMPMTDADALPNLWQVSNALIFGGQQCHGNVFPADKVPLRDCAAETIGETLPASVTGDMSRGRVKWTLLTPAVFPAIKGNPACAINAHPGGWLPNWVFLDWDEEAGVARPNERNGLVLLKHRSGQVRRVWDETKKRTVRRAEVETTISARLVAACVSKPVYISGWSDRKHLPERGDDPVVKELKLQTGSDPRAGYYAVPAGAAYYFEISGGEDPSLLVDLLSWHGQNPPDPQVPIRRRSTLFGEQGFGLGVCSSWDFFEPAAKSDS